MTILHSTNGAPPAALALVLVSFLVAPVPAAAEPPGAPARPQPAEDRGSRSGG
jgi:hypothetical protein